MKGNDDDGDDDDDDNDDDDDDDNDDDDDDSDHDVVHCCTMSLSGIWVPRQIITEIQISRTKIV